MAVAKRPAHPLDARLPANQSVAVRALLLGERLQLRGLSESPQDLGPTVVSAGQAGLVVLFPYGVAVAFNLSKDEERDFLKDLRPRIERPLRKHETEELNILPAARQVEGVTPDGIALVDYSLPRLQVVATVVARSVSLAYHETRVAGAFDLIDPLARDLERHGGAKRLRESLRHIGGALLVQHRMTGRVEVQEKPDLLWERPELERLFLNLENEYELDERDIVLDRKLALIGRTAEIATNLLQNRRMLRVEWYIVILILFEIIWNLVEFLLRR